jgi:hypothetical protein
VIGLLSVLLLGTLILALSVRLLVQARQRNLSPVTTEDYANAREALESVFVETATVNRILSLQDAEFIARSATPDVKCLFLNERKRLAMQWFKETRKQIARLMDLHLRLAAYTYGPNPGFELKLTANYLIFLSVSGSALILLWLLGPFRTTRVLSYTARTAGNFCSVFSLRLERVNPARLGSGR